MKLLLTSMGIVNEPIAASLQRMVNKPREEIKIGFIPTAVYGEKGNKTWFLSNIADIQKFGYTWIDIIEIGIPQLDWKTKLAEADVVFVGGGNTFFLLDQVRKSGFDVWIKENIENKVYVGLSAGSIIATPTIGIATVEPCDENVPGITDLTGLKLVDFEVSPHTPSMISHEANVGYANTISDEFYEFDDETAIEVIDKKVTIISQGNWMKLK